MQVIFRSYEPTKLELEVIARKFLPDLIEFYENENNKKLFEKWLKEKEEMKK